MKSWDTTTSTAFENFRKPLSSGVAICQIVSGFFNFSTPSNTPAPLVKARPSSNTRSLPLTRPCEWTPLRISILRIERSSCFLRFAFYYPNFLISFYLPYTRSFIPTYCVKDYDSIHSFILTSSFEEFGRRYFVPIQPPDALKHVLWNTFSFLFTHDPLS